MAESSEDSEGEELELIRPGLIRELRNVLDEYPDDGQILKEMIQNAEDAGASRVKILADSREFHRQEDARMIKKHPHLKFFQGPALCVYNNEHFTEKDWEGIRMLHTSVKEKDPLKVGRFGLGFKSVFHLTDRLVIVSGKFIMYMDPFKGVDRYCVRKRLAATRGREMESLVHCLDAVFLAGSPHSLDKVFNSHTGLFSGTFFWFPLRRQESELSDTLYTEETLNDLLQAFKAEANSMLMFLKNLEKIELYTRDVQGTKLVFTVELSAKCVSAVRVERSKFKDSVRAARQDLPLVPVCSWSEVEVQMSDCSLQHQSQHKERWLVVNYHAGKNQASGQLLRLCRDTNLSYQPYVGVAVPLGGKPNFQSHLFCFLPLPLETKSPTGLPVHVNGFFALSQNRRHIKWPTADQVHNRAHMEPALQWNCLLVEELLPLAYVELLHRLREIHDKKPDEFYKAWPDVTTVDNRWQPLVQTLYTRLSQGTFFHTSVPTDTWILLSQAVLQNLPPSVEPKVVEAVIHIYTISNEQVVRLPRHVMSALQQLSLENVAQTITPRHVSEMVLTHHQYLQDEYKLLLLQYLCSHGNDLQLLLDRFLLPLQDGTFGDFCRHGRGDEVFWCEKETQVLFPGLEKVMCSSRVSEVIKNHLKNLAKSGQFSLRVVTCSDVARLLEMSIQTRFKGSSIRLSSQDSWIQQVWLYLKNSTPWNADLSRLCHLELLPCLEGQQIKLLPLKGIYVSLSAPGMAQLNKDLSICLSKVGITVVSLPQYVYDHKQILGGLVHYPNSQGILEVLEKVSIDPTTRTKAESDFNRTASEADISSLKMFIANAKQLEPRKVSVLTGLRLFIDMTTRQLVSVRDVDVIGPRDPLPVLPPRSLLMCDESSRSAALKIGASEVTLHTISHDILKHIQQGRYTDLDKKCFMKYFISNAELMAREDLTALARNVTFVPSSSGSLHKPSDLYSLNKDLRELFLGEDLFPCDEFAQPKFISKLKKLGLRDETTVKEDDLVSAAQRIEDLFTRGDKETATRKAEGLWTLLLRLGSQFNLSRLSKIQCMPCLQDRQKPSHYPNNLPLKSDPAIVKPCDMVIYSHLIYCGSTKAVMRPEISKNLTDSLKVSELTLEDVLVHLLNVVNSYDATQSPYYKSILHEVFKSVKNCRNEPSVSRLIGKTACVFVESEGRFACPKQFWVKKRSEDIDLSPYRFPLHNDMSDVSDLLLTCGSSECQDENLLQEVLNEIKTKHETGSISKPEFTKDMRLVKQILDVLKESDSATRGCVLVPISHKHQDRLQFRYAKECTIWSDSLFANFALDGNEDEEIFFVHREISKDTALRLGVLQMKDRALTGIEDLDFGYGQHEDLTDRLHNLLKDSYTDGFSVPKELIQNADDAGATEVKFLLDERENRDARTNLINEQMASLQGPALWAFNNALFSDEDFENIVRLGAGTKRDDVTKVGKFGLGFNSVYNLTDVPSFISRHTLAMFDPHVKYLKGPGLKLDFSKPVNRSLLVRMPEQFKPFQGVFGCTLHKEHEVQYNGTLFRFPLRTKDQASESKIKKEAYSESKRRNFMKMLLERVGNLLTFTQNVKNLEIFYLSSKSTNPVDAECILTLKRSSKRTIIAPLCADVDESVVQFTTKYWQHARDVRLNEDIVEDMTITNSAKLHFNVSPGQSKTQWRIFWASGINQSAQLVEIYRHEKHIPLAAVAVLLNDGHIASLSETPFGFYKSGHLFCFLPLPEEMVRFVIPVHVNGTFALTSSRRSLLAKTEDDVPGMPGDEWNRALFADAVCRAYILLLESLHQEAMADSNFHQYFLVFPKADCEPSLMRHFYAHLVNEENKLLPVPRSKSWVCFRDARFMDPDFRVSDVGEIAWDALNHFWGQMGELLVHVSADFHHQIIAAGQEKSIRERTITHIIFYRDYFFPNINDKTYWTDENRDKLVMYALMHADPNIGELVKHSCCIPCLCTNELKSPKDLIDPHGEAAKLFLESDACFPQRANPYSNRKRTMNFCSSECLSRLVKLGMVKDDLPWHMVIERAESIGSLIATDADEALNRASALIDYLAHRKGSSLRIASCPTDVLALLSNISFLPVLQKPENWPFPWKGNNTDSVLSSPSDLYSDSLKELVACKVKLIDSKAVGLENSSSKVEVLRSLGINDEEKINKQMLCLVIDQLTLISEKCTGSFKINIQQISNICQCIYRYFLVCINEPDETLKHIICSSLRNTASVWVGSGFVPPSKVAFRNKYNCQPFLFELQRVFLPFRQFFSAVGVKDEFDTKDILLVLQEISNQNIGGALTDDIIGVVCQLAELLHDAARRTREDHCLKDANVYLPDRHGHMQHVSCLCLDDCDWVRESETMKFVHRRISPEVAGVLGVQSKRVRDIQEMFSSIAIPFGQHEELTTRIKRLLEGYTCDSSIFYELVQNADDAGATEIKIIKDFRSLPTERIPLGWESLQGPALCVYNNKSFTAEDIKGIQSLGIGSKREDMLTTGKYGVGFNAVYHITDVPSFWTREDDNNDVVCIFDPNCEYAAGATPSNPGMKITDVNRLQENYPDMFAGYLGNCIDMKQPGTLFRFPLRHEEMAKKSQIKKDTVMKEDDIVKLIETFTQQLSTCLLFLNNIRTIAIYAVSDNDKLCCEYKVTMTIEDDINEKQIAQFQRQVLQTAKYIQNKTSDIKGIQPFEVVIKANISDSKGLSEEYLIVNMAGFTGAVTVSQQLDTEWQKEHFRILPRGGVAVKLNSRNQTINYHKAILEKHLAFCFLPLPVETNLPVHVNGNFALDHETRRDLWTKKDHVQTEWNTLIATGVIVPAYIRAIEVIKNLWFEDTKLKTMEKEHISMLNFYHSLFPDPSKAPSDFWRVLITFLYKELSDKELPLFPVVFSDTANMEWVSAVRRDAFPGYFSNLESTFKKEYPPLSMPSLVLTSQYDMARKRAQELTNVLKDINMKILYAPYKIFQYFVASGVQEVKEVTPEDVIKFLKSAKHRRSDGCCVADLPQPVSATRFKTCDNLKALLSYIKDAKDFLSNLEGLPLCLRQSKTVYFFEKAERENLPFVSTFLHLLSGSYDSFVHESIMGMFLPISEKTKDLLRDLDIPSLTLMLPASLPEKHYKTGLSWAYNLHVVQPFREWLKRFWDFVGTQINKKDHEADSDFRRRTNKALESLAQWTLIPAVRRTGDATQRMLYRVKDSHLVVYLQSSPTEYHPRMWHILKNLPVPVLDMECLYDSNKQILVDLVASVSHPYALLHALSCPFDNIRISINDAYEVLQFFSNTLPVLQDYCSEENTLCDKLKRLPFFVTVNGETVPLTNGLSVLILSDDIPSNGLKEWSRSQTKLLLRADCLPGEITEILRLSQPSSADFYAKFLLPTLTELHKSDILKHMTYIINNMNNFNRSDREQLVQQLKITAFLDKGGVLCKASEFLSPHEPVFREFCNSSSLPPAPYKGKKWKTLMEESGMVCKVSHDKFLEFARCVEEEGKQGISRIVEKRSDLLVNHLFSRVNLREDRILHDIKGICFVLPATLDEIDDGTFLKIIAQPPNTNRLVSFSESCQVQHAYLIWSSSVMVKDSLNPVRLTCHRQDQKEILQELQFEECAPMRKVIEHTRNICSALASEKGPEIFSVLSQKSEGLLTKIMMTIYEFFSKNAKNEDIEVLKMLPIVCDVENEKMMRPETVVIDLRPEEAIAGEVEKAPTIFGQFFRFFQTLGVEMNVTANSYAKVLLRLKTKTKDERLNVQELNIVKKAVEGLFRCLKSETKETKNLSVSHLFLPNRRKGLETSTNLIFVDNKVLGRRFKGSLADAQFFLGFRSLEIKVSQPLDEVQLLPEKYQMKRFSSIVREIIPDDVKTRAYESEQSRRAENKVQITFVVEAILWFMYEKNQKQDFDQFLKESEEWITRCLRHIKTKQVDNLHTVLYFNGAVVENSQEKKKLFIDKREEGTFRSCTVYLDQTVCNDMEKHNEELCSYLFFAVQFVLNTNLQSQMYYLTKALEDPVKAMKLFERDGLHISGHLGHSDYSVFPLLGSFIPVEDHCFLDSGFYQYSAEEFVGFEMYDPLINGNEKGELELDTSEYEANPVYIYAVVKGMEHESEQRKLPPLSRKYRIFLGDEKGEAVVSVLRIYKFVRKEKIANNIVRLSDESEANRVKSMRLDIKSVLRKIRETLIEAWQLQDEADRRRIIKRLILTWHPDKNRDNEAFCTRVMQMLNHYIERLERGEKIRIDEDEDEQEHVDNRFYTTSASSSFSSFSSSSSSSSAYSHFFNFMKRRAAQHRDYYQSSSSSSTSTPNKQTGEGRRWFRQAQADLRFAHTARQSFRQGHNWICYHCHQAVEKAIKAVLFSRDANTFQETSHDIKSLASLTGDSEIIGWVREIEDIVGLHTRMRYPDVLTYPSIPDDVYTADQASRVCIIASNIVHRVESLL